MSQYLPECRIECRKCKGDYAAAVRRRMDAESTLCCHNWLYNFNFFKKGA